MGFSVRVAVGMARATQASFTARGKSLGMKSAPTWENGTATQGWIVSLEADEAHKELGLASSPPSLHSLLVDHSFHSPAWVSDNVNQASISSPLLLPYPVASILPISFGDGTTPLQRGNLDYSGSE